MTPHALPVILALLLSFAGMGRAATSVSQEADPQQMSISFELVRKGDRIGTHEIEFTRDGAELNVAVDIDIEVNILFFTAFSCERRVRETWHGGDVAFPFRYQHRAESPGACATGSERRTA